MYLVLSYFKYLNYLLIILFFGYVNALIVTTDYGKLAGIKLESRNGTPFYAYFGIPYAKPPIGALRFEVPQEPEKWKDIREAGLPKPKCFQWDRFFSFLGVGGSEDCLYLNVFTPTIAQDADLPVMVCIHGGAFFRGESTECFPSYFMDKKIVMVTIAYRLGLLGFLSAGDKVIPGNYGMKDQVAALKWVQKNIKNFGGNPNCVTIFGESAGGVSVHLHMYSPLSAGLFHRAISQSGSATVPWATVPRDLSRNKTYSLGILTGCPLTSTQLLLDCLRKIPAADLISIFPKFFIWNFEPTVLFPVVIELDIDGAFLTKKPQDGEEINQVPWIVGITSGEGGLVAAQYLSNSGVNVVQFNEHYKRYMPVLFCYYYTAKLDDLETLSETIRQRYFGDKDIGILTSFQLRDMVTDGAFAYYIVKSAKKYNKSRYFYYYDHLNVRSFNEIWGESPFMKFLGVSHGDDLISFFPQLWMFPEAVLVGKDLQLSIKLINYWTNFAYNGDPNNINDFQTKWDPVSTTDLEYLHLTGVVDEMSSKLLSERLSFWENLPLGEKENKIISENKEQHPITEDIYRDEL